jgi:hypothetical protein
MMGPNVKSNSCPQFSKHVEGNEKVPVSTSTAKIPEYYAHIFNPTCSLCCNPLVPNSYLTKQTQWRD